MWKVGIPFFLAVALDQVSKILIRMNMEKFQSFDVLGSFFRITYVLNPGIAFGIKVKNPIVFTILSVAACIGIIIYLIRNWQEDMQIKISLALILGGAVGNLIDRILFGEVVDFLDFGINHIRWPVFNIADSSVVIGMMMLFVYAFFLSDKDKKETSESQ
jgi:signal peptidase II